MGGQIQTGVLRPFPPIKSAAKLLILMYPFFENFSQYGVGENALHLACLFYQKMNSQQITSDFPSIVRHLVLSYGPRLVNAPYQAMRDEDDSGSAWNPGRFDGETVLHMVRRAGLVCYNALGGDRRDGSAWG